MNVFDIIGPVMIGPSSSHTAGAVRIGKVAHALLGVPAKKALIELHGSFAKTYKGHGTDRALAAGIMGFAPDDIRIRDSLKLAEKSGLQLVFTECFIEEAHPNTARITLESAQGKIISLEGCSVGGGNIRIKKVGGMAVDISCDFTTYVILNHDTPGAVAAVSRQLAQSGVNIGSLILHREQKGGRAVMTLEVDSAPSEQINAALANIPGVISSTVLPPQ